MASIKLAPNGRILTTTVTEVEYAGGALPSCRSPLGFANCLEAGHHVLSDILRRYCPHVHCLFAREVSKMRWASPWRCIWCGVCHISAARHAVAVSGWEPSTNRRWGRA